MRSTLSEPLRAGYSTLDTPVRGLHQRSDDLDVVDLIELRDDATWTSGSVGHGCGSCPPQSRAPGKTIVPSIYN